MFSPRIEMMRERLLRAFSPTLLQVIDESEHHIGHAGHQGGGRHFAIMITAPALNRLSRLAAHRAIYALFDDMIPEQIHALRITIKP